MERRFVLCIFLSIIITTLVSHSQQVGLESSDSSEQELSIEPLQSVDAVNTSIDLCATSLKANLLAILSSESGIKLYEIPSLKERMILSYPPTKIAALSFSSSGQTLALGATDGNLYLYNINTPANPKNLSAHSRGITSIAFQGENWMFSAGLDRKLIIMDAMDGEVIGSLSNFKEDITAIAVHPGTKYFALGLSTGKIQIYAIAKLELQKIFSTAKIEFQQCVTVLMENF